LAGRVMSFAGDVHVIERSVLAGRQADGVADILPGAADDFLERWLQSQADACLAASGDVFAVLVLSVPGDRLFKRSGFERFGRFRPEHTRSEMTKDLVLRVDNVDGDVCLGFDGETDFECGASFRYDWLGGKGAYARLFGSCSGEFEFPAEG